MLYIIVYDYVLIYDLILMWFYYFFGFNVMCKNLIINGEI